jgi:hypothetical protein
MAKQWRAVVNYSATGSWQQNGFFTKEAAEKAAQVKASVIRQARKRNGRSVDDVSWRAEEQA